jgi:hypothetical protein
MLRTIVTVLVALWILLTTGVVAQQQPCYSLAGSPKINGERLVVEIRGFQAQQYIWYINDEPPVSE